MEEHEVNVIEERLMVVGPWMLIRECVVEMEVTLSAGLIASEERVIEPHCASTRVNADVRRNSMVDNSREMVETADVVNSEVWPSMELILFFVPDTPVIVRVDATGIETDSAV